MAAETTLHHATAPQTALRVLYVGPQPSTARNVLGSAQDEFALTTETSVTGATFKAATEVFQTVIVDQRQRDDARTLLIAALAASRSRPRIVVLAMADDVGYFLRCPGVRAVVQSPLKPDQLRRAVVPPRTRAEQPAPAEAVPAIPDAPAAGVAVALADPARAAALDSNPGVRKRLLSTAPFMRIVSALYKNAAFVLLATLFSAFCFYGFLIGYFLLASGWGAPITLTRGHELVEKAIRDVGELQVGMSVAQQHLSEAQLEYAKAGHAREDAVLRVQFMKGTIDSEIESRTRLAKLARKSAERLRGAIGETSTGKSKTETTSPQELYRKRLITRRTFEALAAGSLEAAQRQVMMENEIDNLNAEARKQEDAVVLLHALRAQLDGGIEGGIQSGNADLMLLTKEVIDSRTTLETAEQQAKSAEGRQALLQQSAALMKQRIAELQEGPLGRAAQSRVDVIFVPYGNERSFQEGAPLYSCALTVLFCHRAGAVGKATPGESSIVHPFFGKPIRGYFVEMHLDDPDAATQEIIHAGRAPFFL